MIRLKFLAVALVATMSTSALAEVKKGAQAAAEARPDDLICTYESTIGSHMKRRVCATRAQRDEAAQADQRNLQGLQSGRSGRGKGTGAAGESRPGM